ncbi:MAG: hypothetical protein AVDCRST_MAG59-3098, partial [uncultured Thermomicrobiales bacterium]
GSAGVYLVRRGRRGSGSRFLPALCPVRSPRCHRGSLRRRVHLIRPLHVRLRPRCPGRRSRRGASRPM